MLDTVWLWYRLKSCGGYRQPPFVFLDFVLASELDDDIVCDVVTTLREATGLWAATLGDDEWWEWECAPFWDMDPCAGCARRLIGECVIVGPGAVWERNTLDGDWLLPSPWWERSAGGGACTMVTLFFAAPSCTWLTWFANFKLKDTKTKILMRSEVSRRKYLYNLKDATLPANSFLSRFDGGRYVYKH